MKVKNKSVNQAIQVLQSSKEHGKDGKNDAETEKIGSQCNVMHFFKRKKKQQFTCFSKNLILSEIKSHIASRDWRQTRNLLLSLLYSSTDIEPTIWRYAFIIALYSSTNSSSSVTQFLESCIGSQHSEVNMILRNLLLLSN